MASDGCMVCSKDREGHRQAEAAGEVNHEFSETGQLVPLKKPERTVQTQTLPFDPVLRLLLVEKGLVTGAELEEMSQRLASTGLVSVSSARD